MNIRITPLCILAALGLSPILHADLVLETETAELGKKGEWLVSSALQYEHERDGSTTLFTLNQYEYAWATTRATRRRFALDLTSPTST